MKSTFKSASIAVIGAVALFATENAEAILISGEIYFAGSVVPGIPVTGDGTVSGGTGSYAGLAGLPTTFVIPGFTIGDQTGVTIWEAGGFSLVANGLVTSAPNLLGTTYTGNGVASGPAGFEDTLGSFEFNVLTALGTGPTRVTFVGSSATDGTPAAAQVPDGGLTILLFGVSLFGLGMARNIHLKRA